MTAKQCTKCKSKNLQLLCANCNLGKAVNKGVCPHASRMDSACEEGEG